MGPRHFSRGITEITEKRNLAHMLQWGRGISAAEFALFGVVVLL